MESTRKKKLIVCWSLVTAIPIVLFWAIWHLLVGSVPVVTTIEMSEEWIITLPFGVSRWWDVLIGPIGLIIIISFLTDSRVKKVIGCYAGFVVPGLITGLLISLFINLGPNLELDNIFISSLSGLSLRIAIGLIIYLWAVVCMIAASSLYHGIVFGLLTCISASIGVSLYFGVVMGLSIFLLLATAVSISYLIDIMIGRNIRKWLLAK